ncbi:MAG: hypothetical protein IRZ13_17805 [Acetobacteraceae bacterium]|nr:hypothetical protein [Acetobacteraceae bacterium]
MKQQPLAWLFFKPFIIVSTFVVPNRFTGVIAQGIQAARDDRDGADGRAAQAVADTAAACAACGFDALLRVTRALREEAVALRASASAGPARALDEADRARALHDLMPPGVAGLGCAA